MTARPRRHWWRSDPAGNRRQLAFAGGVTLFLLLFYLLAAAPLRALLAAGAGGYLADFRERSFEDAAVAIAAVGNVEYGVLRSDEADAPADWRPLPEQQSLSRGAIVRVGAAGYVDFLLDARTRFRLGPRGRMVFRRMQVPRTAPGPRQVTLGLLRGSLVSSVGKLSSADEYTVQTPVSVIGVRGTRFRVALEEEEVGARGKVLRQEVSVSEGQVAVAAAGAGGPDAGGLVVNVRPGQTARVAVPVSGLPPALEPLRARKDELAATISTNREARGRNAETMARAERERAGHNVRATAARARAASLAEQRDGERARAAEFRSLREAVPAAGPGADRGAARREAERHAEAERKAAVRAAALEAERLSAEAEAHAAETRARELDPLIDRQAAAFAGQEAAIGRALTEMVDVSAEEALAAEREADRAAARDARDALARKEAERAAAEQAARDAPPAEAARARETERRLAGEVAALSRHATELDERLFRTEDGASATVRVIDRHDEILLTQVADLDAQPVNLPPQAARALLGLAAAGPGGAGTDAEPDRIRTVEEERLARADDAAKRRAAEQAARDRQARRESIEEAVRVAREERAAAAGEETAARGRRADQELGRPERGGPAAGATGADAGASPRPLAPGETGAEAAPPGAAGVGPSDTGVISPSAPAGEPGAETTATPGETPAEEPAEIATPEPAAGPSPEELAAELEKLRILEESLLREAEAARLAARAEATVFIKRQVEVIARELEAGATATLIGAALPSAAIRITLFGDEIRGGYSGANQFVMTEARGRFIESFGRVSGLRITAGSPSVVFESETVCVARFLVIVSGVTGDGSTRQAQKNGAIRYEKLRDRWYIASAIFN
ncbi:MAG: FecR domain-containing protein [Planctomycetes bacterium]|nr:FecR domain-containing protein [Planctomycetota bacterium]